MIVFKYKKINEGYVQMKSVEDATWKEVADDFVNFLQGCGYIVTGIEVAEYLEEQYAFQARKDEKVEPVIELRHEPKKKKRKKK